MTGHQHDHRPRSAMQLAEQGIHRPRRSPAESAPRVSDADRPDPAELARQRARLARRGRYVRDRW